MAKPMLVTFPFLLLLDYWPLGRTGGSPLRLVLEKVPLLVLALADTAFSVVQGRRVGALRTLTGLPFPSRVANAVLAYTGYLRKALWPADLAVLYPYPHAFGVLPVATAVLVLAGVSAVALAFARRAPYLIVGWLWYLGTVAPTIGLLQVGHQSMADRYTYVPLVGVFLAAAFGGRALVERYRLPRWPVAGAVAAALVACVAATFAQASRWRSSVTLFRHALAVTTDNFMAHEKLAEALDAEGRHAEALRISPRRSGSRRPSPRRTWPLPTRCSRGTMSRRRSRTTARPCA
jgi:hypothetical protein